MYQRILALFSCEPYCLPKHADHDSKLSLTPHLTNTSLQIHRGEEGVRLLDEMCGNHILSDGTRSPALTERDIADIQRQMSQIIAEVFKAAIEQPVHFQVCRFFNSTVGSEHSLMSRSYPTLLNFMG